MITAIDFRLQKVESKISKPKENDKNFARQKIVYDRKMDGIIKAREFLDWWFLEDIILNDSSLLYPHKVGNKLQLKISKQIELRQLNAANEKHKWFIEYIMDMPTFIAG